MSAPKQQTPLDNGPIEMTGDQFDKEFGLEPNKGPAAPPSAEADDAAQEEEGAVEAELGAAADDVLAHEDLPEDNVARLDLLEQRAEQRRKAAENQREASAAKQQEGQQGEEQQQDIEGEPEEDVDEGEGRDEEQPAAEADERESEIEGEPAQPQDDASDTGFLNGIGRLDPEQAQQAFDALIERFGDQLRLRYRGAGQELFEPLTEVRTKAAGYMGQGEVDRTFKEARRLHEEANQLRESTERFVEALDDPARFVDEILLPTADMEFVRELYKRLDTELETYEREPLQYEMRRELRQLRGEIASLRNPGKAAGQAEPEPQDEPATQPQPQGADEYGYIQGQGYPQAQLRPAFIALKAAANAAGVEVKDVLQEWQGKKEQTPFQVLRSMVRTRYAEATKVETARNQPVKRRPQGKGGVRTPARNQAARKPPRFEDLEAEVAAEVRELFGS